MNELIKKVEQWAIDRNLHTADSKGQALKVVEEFTETLIAHNTGVEEEMIDGIGDTYVTLIILCQQLHTDFLEILNKTHRYWGYLDVVPEAINWLVSGVAKGDKHSIDLGSMMILSVLENFIETYGLSEKQCLSVAYNEIKDRKGKMIDGVFVKESDLEG